MASDTRSTPKKLSSVHQLTEDDLSFVPPLAASVSSELGDGVDVDEERLRMAILTAVRRALRHPDIRARPDTYPAFCIALCAVTHLCPLSISQTLKLYLALPLKVAPVSADMLQLVYDKAWKQIVHLLKLPSVSVSVPSPTKTPARTPTSTSIPEPRPVPVPGPASNLLSPGQKEPIAQPSSSHVMRSAAKPPKTPGKTPGKTSGKTPKIPKTPKTPNIAAAEAGIFSNTRILLVPSLLFPNKQAQTLCTRASERGATTSLLSPGAIGFSEALQLSDSIKKKRRSEVEEGDQAANENDERVVVIADAALTKRRIKEASELDCVVSPNWLSDSLRARRVKSTNYYSLTPSKKDAEKSHPHQSPAEMQIVSVEDADKPEDLKWNYTEVAPKAPSDFRAEASLVKTPLSGSKRKLDDDFDNCDSNGEIEAGTFLTVATRLFESPKKKSQSQAPTVFNNDEENHDGKKSLEVIGGNKEGECNVPKASKQKRDRNERGGRWACEIRTGVTQTDFPANDRICELLSIVQAAYDAKRDAFRSMGYQKAIARLKTIDYEILCMGDVRRLQDEAYIGSGMADKVSEIVKTGRLKQAEAVLEDSDYNAIQTLCGVWGIGPVRALQLFNQGIRSIEALRKGLGDGTVMLDRCQRIGLNRYEDLLQRMPRSYVGELEMYVRKVTKSVDTSVNVTIAGSYIRGKQNCGDADLLVHGDARRVRIALPKIRAVMKKDGVLTDDLVEGDGKYFGVFRLPGRPHGRIDLFAVPEEEFPYSLLTYTGSAVFNRSMRAKARALGYSLSHRTMQRVIRNEHGKSRMEPPIVVKDERDIFEMLDIPYVPPSQRSIK